LLGFPFDADGLWSQIFLIRVSAGCAQAKASDEDYGLKRWVAAEIRREAIYQPLHRPIVTAGHPSVSCLTTHRRR